MSEIRPFGAIRYAALPDSKDISTRLAPPYDVLDQADKDALLAADGRNFVKIDLPHVPPKTAGPIALYTDANKQLRAWLDDETLVRDNNECLYVYHQGFSHDGREYTRKMFFARQRLERFGEGGVFPHEKTFGGPKEDRLALTKATTCNMSPIFGLYPDPDNIVAARLQQSLTVRPIVCGDLDDTTNQLWAISDRKAIAEIAALMADKPMFIADGHHRYGTALLYRDWMVELQGELPPDHPANFVLTVFCAMEDPGLLILPTHRVLSGVNLTAEMLKAEPDIEVAHLLVNTPDDVPAALTRFGPQAVAMCNSVDDGFYMVRPQNPELLAALEPDHCPAWHKLGLAFLHAFVIDRLVSKKLSGGKAPEVAYVKSAGPAVEQARSTKGTAFLMQPSTMEELGAVCSAGDLMPQKSTFFYPKLASGLVVNPLE
jgi:uncharacterized protein (DUF1015 family)